MTEDRRSVSQRRLDDDARLGVPRLRQFITAMIPISIGYLGVFVAGAVAWRSLALAIGVGAIVVYIGALLVARRTLAAGRTGAAALWTGGGLLAMVVIATTAVHFQLVVFTLIAIASVVVVLPHLEREVLRPFAAIAVVVVVVVLALGTLPPLLPQPPEWFGTGVSVSSGFAAATLIIIMLAADHQRMRALVGETQRARDATDAFLVAAAHQFRTPVSTLLLQSEALLRASAADDGARARAERLVRAAARLRLLVDAMLDVSRITSGTLHLDIETVDVAALVRDVADAHRWSARDAGVELVVAAPEPAEVDADARRLELVTSQLIDAAIRHGRGAPARLEVHRDRDDVVLAVTDGGDVLPPAQRDRLFDRETSAPAGADGGAGVGLWLVRALSQAMGGDAVAHPGDGRGTRFEVRLPRRGA